MSDELDGLLEELSPSAFGLLAILSEEPRTGYQLKKLIDQPELVYWKDSFGSIYPNLKKITELGLAVKERRDLGDRKRLYYLLTEKGRDLVELWLEKPARKQTVKVELLLKLRYAHKLGPGAVKNLLMEYRNHYRDLLPAVFDARDFVEGLHDGSLQAETRKITADFWYRFNRMLYEWSRESLESLSALTGEDD